MTKHEVVAIITRTKDRSLLLKRAIESVLDQSYPHWEMVIVNDGGEPTPVVDLIQHYSRRADGRIRVIHNTCSLGMKGASTVGFDHAVGDLMIVHDDDDSWAPEFLSIAVTSLQQMRRRFPSVAGVATYCNKIWERIHGHIIHVEAVEPFNGWIPAGFLSLDRALVSNILPPISFLFMRQAFERLDRVYERVPYIGDWDFLVRFLVQNDVYMIPQYLAFYHWRSGSDGSLGNSVLAEEDQHHFYRQLLLNEWLRSDLTTGRFGLGAYANLRSQLELIVQQGNARAVEPH